MTIARSPSPPLPTPGDVPQSFPDKFNSAVSMECIGNNQDHAGFSRNYLGGHFVDQVLVI